MKMEKVMIAAVTLVLIAMCVSGCAMFAASNAY
jgi:hypothetical protein